MKLYTAPIKNDTSTDGNTCQVFVLNDKLHENTTLFIKLLFQKHGIKNCCETLRDLFKVKI